VSGRLDGGGETEQHRSRHGYGQREEQEAAVEVRWMQRVLTERGFQATIAFTVEDAGERVALQAPDAAILDYVLPDGDGVSLAQVLLEALPDIALVMMSGMELDEADRMVCRAKDIPMLTKPFLADELLATLDAPNPTNSLRARAEGR